MPIDRATTALRTWSKERVGNGFVEAPSRERFPDVLRLLEPMVMIGRRRELLIDCAGGWTAYYDNNARGTDASSAIGHLCMKLACDGIAIDNEPHTAHGNEGIAGAVIFEYFGPHRTEFLNYIRSVAVAYDGRRWEFQVAGEPQPFETTDTYRARSPRDRFTSEMLVNYCRALGVSPYDPEFYRDRAVLFAQTEPVRPPNAEVSLTQARVWLGLDK